MFFIKLGILLRSFIAYISKHIEEISIMYLDPCHLTRYCKLTNEPRELLSKIPNVKIIEFNEFKENSYCCGAYVIKLIDRNVANSIGFQLLKQVIENNIKYLITSCPFCQFHLIE